MGIRTVDILMAITNSQNYIAGDHTQNVRHAAAVQQFINQNQKTNESVPKIPDDIDVEMEIIKQGMPNNNADMMSSKEHKSKKDSKSHPDKEILDDNHGKSLDITG